MTFTHLRGVLMQVSIGWHLVDIGIGKVVIDSFAKSVIHVIL